MKAWAARGRLMKPDQILLKTVYDTKVGAARNLGAVVGKYEMTSASTSDERVLELCAMLPDYEIVEVEVIPVSAWGEKH